MQQILEVNKLYELQKVRAIVRNANLGIEPDKNEHMGQGNPRISVYNGSVDLYGSDKILGLPSSQSEMILDTQGISGIHVFETLPDYIYLTGTSTMIVLSGAIYTEAGVFA